MKDANSAAYEAALTTVRVATVKYNAIADQFRARKIGTEAFLAAKAEYQDADAAFELVAEKEVGG